jgi:ADP-heptose:LPS heptosyltransferase
VSAPRCPLDAERPVALLANGIGDAVLGLPALRALAALFHGRLTVVCPRSHYESFFHGLPIRPIHPEFRLEGDTRRVDAAALTRQIEGCDLFLSLVPWFNADLQLLLDLVGPPDSIGFFPPYRRHIPLDYRKHSAELAFDLVRDLCPSAALDGYAAPPDLPDWATRWARETLSEIVAPVRVLALHMETLPSKMWPGRRLERVLAGFLEEHPDTLFVAVGSRAPALTRRRVARRLIPATGLALPVSAALVSLADAFLGVDSCMLHVADLARVPGVGLFGPTSPAEFGFRFAAHRHVSGGGAMSGVHEDEVLDALLHVFETHVVSKGA